MTSKISYSKFIGKHPQERLASGSLHDPDVFHADALDRDADRNASFRFRSLSESRCSLSGKSAFCRIFERLENPLFAVLVVLLALCCAVSGFSYLHRSEEIDFFHSLPLARRQLFLISYTGD